MTCPTDTRDNACPQCGFWRTERFSSGKFKKCPGCTADERRARDRVVAERRRRARGAVKVKGVQAKCARCETDIVLAASRHKFCKPCGDAVKLEKANAASLSARIKRGGVLDGTVLSCAHCSEPFVKKGPLQKYCLPCRGLNKAGKLPHLREARKRYQKEVWGPLMKTDPERIERERLRQRSSRERRKADPAFTINERMSAGVRQSLAHGKEGYRWEALVGYTLSDLMRHLERQFLPGMTWENRREWHIDHIQPLASFRIERAGDAEFVAAWSITNLRPLWALDNIAKNDRRTHLL